MKAKWILEAATLAAVLLLLAVTWPINRAILSSSDRPPMSMTTEWSTPSGRTERFTSYRGADESFQEFNRKHDAAVVEIGGPK